MKRLPISFALLACAVMSPLNFADTYPRQAGVDAQHYVFRLELSDTSEEFVGEATAELLFTEAGIGDVTLDLLHVGSADAAGGRGGGGRGRGRGAATGPGTAPASAPATVPAAAAVPRGMKVASVQANGAALRYVHENNKLRISLAAPSTAGQKLAITVRYQGLPGPAMHIQPNRFGDRSFFSENWPDRARGWIPCIDHPSDKATSEFIVTAPSKYQVVANGLLQSKTDAGGKTTTHWKQGVPISTWLNAIGVSNFAMHEGAPVRGIPLQTWVYPGNADFAPAIEDASTKSLEFYIDYVGPYPYEKLANVQAAGIGGGTEHSSAIFYGQTNLNANGPFNLIAHEIAHQWWGCSVTEKDWDDVWLSEGFATYFTLMAVEKYQGKEAFLAGVRRSRTSVMSTQANMPAQPVIHQNLSNMRAVLNQLVYQKGGWVLHMLRGEVGDEAFQKGIRAYYAKYRDKNASTDDFRAEMEAASGKKLDWFFEQWLRRPGHPVIEGTWNWDAAGKKVVVELSQVQAGEAFRVPVEIAVGADAAAKVTRVEMMGKAGRFEVAADSEPGTVVLDPNTWVLGEAKVEKK